MKTLNTPAIESTEDNTPVEQEHADYLQWCDDEFEKESVRSLRAKTKTKQFKRQSVYTQEY